jgi:hypothetical protein
MRRFLIISPLILICLVLAICAGGVTLAAAHPIPSYGSLFPLQDLSEQAVVLFTFNSEKKAELLMDLVELRVQNLEAAAGSSGEVKALSYLDRTLTQALRAVADIPDENSAAVQARLATLVHSIQNGLKSLTVLPDEYLEAFTAFQVKMETLKSVIAGGSFAAAAIDQVLRGQVGDPIQIGGQNSETLLSQANLESSAIPTQLVPFPPGSPGALHQFFPLTGEHSKLFCADCHTGDQYSGLPTACVACHQADEPPNHYPADCSSCHTPDSWQAVTFSHSAFNTSDCVSCHIQEKPANHYNGQCSACHTNAAWTPASFNHAATGATNCISCHSKVAPPNHYQGQCSACHNVNAWKPATFNHGAVGATDCFSCHSSDKPANHFGGQCSACHSTNKWKPATFNHGAVGATDCVSCHSSDKPANHFSGQCSACHSTNKWKPASFDHSLVSNDCASCHNSDKPANHFSGQCSNCHNTNAWEPANFDHSQVSNDCISCHLSDKPGNHFDGQCSNCHNTNAWEPANFDHSQITNNCVSCHLDDAPGQHFTSECSQCHNTNNWGNVNLTHTFPIGHKNADGKCQKCHPSLTAAWSCDSCHPLGQMIEHHEGIPDIAGRCLECHWDGKTHDD